MGTSRVDSPNPPALRLWLPAWKDSTMIPPVLPTYNRTPLTFVKGEGSWLTADDGQRYLDLGAGIAVNALGHANPDLVAALTAQAQKVWHVSNLYRIEEQERLARQLVDATFADTYPKPRELEKYQYRVYHVAVDPRSASNRARSSG